MAMLLTEGRALWSSLVVAFGESGLDKKREATQDDRKCAQSTICQQTARLKSIKQKCRLSLKRMVSFQRLEGGGGAEEVDGVRVFFFSRRRRFDVWGVAGGYEEEGVSLNVR